MKQQRSTLGKNGDAAGRPSWRSSLLGDPDAKFPCGKVGTLIRHTKNSLNFLSTCLKVVDTRRTKPIRFADPDEIGRLNHFFVTQARE